MKAKFKFNKLKAKFINKAKFLCNLSYIKDCNSLLSDIICAKGPQAMFNEN